MLLGFVNMLKEYLDLFKNSELKVIPEAEHSIATEQPELYISTINDFLTRD